MTANKTHRDSCNLKLLACEFGKQLVGFAKKHGYCQIDPNILIPAKIVLDLAGEDIRNRMLIASNSKGPDYALRTDCTIPIARHYIAQGNNHQVSYCYCAPVFRARDHEASETLQAGIEIINLDDPIKSDAISLSFAIKLLTHYDCRDVWIYTGDVGLFNSFIDSLNLAPAWRRRLLGVFGNPIAVKNALTFGENNRTNTDSGSRQELNSVPEIRGRKIVEDLMKSIGIQPPDARSADEIAKRFIEQSALRTPIPKSKSEAIKRFISLTGNPQAVLTELDELFSGLSQPFDEHLQVMRNRLEALRDEGISFDNMIFATAFGRHIDYYTGFIFECTAKRTGHDPQCDAKSVLAAGGRYDGLFTRLGHESPVSAVGAALWLERIAAQANINNPTDDDRK